MANLDSIKAQIAKLTKQAQAIESKAVQKVLALMNRLGVTVDDLPQGKGRRKRTAGGAGSRGRATVGAAKYRDPKTGKTWTGHGRAPEWIKNATNRDEYLIGGAGATGASAPVKAAKKARKAPGKKAAAKRPAKSAAKKTG